MRGQLSTGDRLTAELAAITGDTCGHNCDHHVHPAGDGDHQLVCLRKPRIIETVDGREVTRPEHAGAAVLADLHVGRMPDGSVVTFGDECCVEAVMTG